MSPGARARKASTPQEANNNPARPPAIDSKRLSVDSCRARRKRDAPRAARTAISRRRPEVLESIRLATFEQAMRSTAPAAASRIHSALRYDPTTSSLIGTSRAVSPRLVAGYCCASCAYMIFSSASALATEESGFRRPTTFKQWLVRPGAVYGKSPIGMRVRQPGGPDAPSHSTRTRPRAANAACV